MRPTPKRQPDPRLSNFVLEGGHKKAAPSNVIPPPGPDVDLHGNPRSPSSLPRRFYSREDVVVAGIIGVMVGAFAISMLLRCG